MAARVIRAFHAATPRPVRLFSSGAAPHPVGAAAAASAASSAASLQNEAFLQAAGSIYALRMHEHWRRDSSSVHASWDAYFRSLEAAGGGDVVVRPPAAGEAGGAFAAAAAAISGAAPAPGAAPAAQSALDAARLIQLVRGYQSRGHEWASVDPLNLPREKPYVSVPRLHARREPIDFRTYGFTEADLDRVFDCRVPGVTGVLSVDREPTTLRALVNRLEEVYCGSIGVEISHIEDPHVLDYLRQALETPEKYSFPPEMKRRIFTRTARAKLFESFCGQKFNTTKRFGVDGCESAIVTLKAVAKRAVESSVASIMIGMPHRGRLNTLVNVLHKPMSEMVSEFRNVPSAGFAEWGNSGDVKYHLGQNFDHYDADTGQWVHMGVLANPSHLEAVDPLVLGQVRAQQYFCGDEETRSRVLPVLMHGDAAFAGQGVVYETLQMSKLPNYAVGGCVHIIVNNQIGFTTNVIDQGSGRYATDLAKCIEAPVFHVNGDDPEACTFIANLAVDFRQRFHQDVFINLMGYRLYGHNELDMPKFTQPRMYNTISKHPSVLDIYRKRLIAEGIINEEYADTVQKEILAEFNEEYEKSIAASKAAEEAAAAAAPASGTPAAPAPALQRAYAPQWRHMATPDQTCPPRKTGVPVADLAELGRLITELPATFTPHATIRKTYAARREAIETGKDIDFGFAEALAFATLLSDGFHVRFSGQDVQRGTFSHRHAVLHDQVTFDEYTPLRALSESRGWAQRFQANNSLLSEYAALGFEVGYALEHPDTLAVWEAQFGDFANGAQIVIDQFIASGEAKWGQQSGVVLLLPHGYDGQGPEHSSARIERFLQLCDDREDVIDPRSWNVEKCSVIQQHNMQVVNCTTPANFFHVLRRQMHRGFRKPLIVFSPKRMLKMRATFSRLPELGEGSAFLRYIPDVAVPEATRGDFICVDPRTEPVNEKVERLILCSGQIYYDLAAFREKHAAWNVAVARVEQISPFPYDRFIDDVKRYPNLKSLAWAQEEPMNAGAWSYVSHRLACALRHLGAEAPLVYAGRDVGAAPATGDPNLHKRELEYLLRAAFDTTRNTNAYHEKYTMMQQQQRV